MSKLSRIAIAVIALLLAGAVRPLPQVYADGASPCPGSLPTRLAVGDTGEVARSFSSLRNSPGGLVIQVMYTGARFTVLEGPVCAGGLTFYRIDYGGGLVGWASESQIDSPWGSQYWLAPVGDDGGEPEPLGCAGSLAPRLEVGDIGRVARSFSSLRSSPAGPVISVRYTHEQFTVLEGPTCAGGLVFFKIDYGGGLVGWASESEIYSPWGSQYWLEPVP